MAKQLPVTTAHFALETCYYGLGLRARVGAILLTDSEIIHHSYAWHDTLWAILEPSIRVSIPLGSLREVFKLRLTLGVRLMQMDPDSAFRVMTHEGHIHDLVLQRRGVEFVQALRSRGVTIPDESRVA